jgi:proteasome assembly chaperone 3
VQIASSIALRNPEESRSVLVGLGLEREELSREGFVDLVEAVGRCL